MGTLLKDFRFAARTLWKNRAVTAVAVAALALGVGANTAVFSVVNAALLTPLPYREPARLVRVSEYSEQVPQLSVSYPNFLDWRAQATSFEAMAAVQPASYNLSGAGEAERLSGRNVSHEFFHVLGVGPGLGRVFTAEEDAPGGARVVVISHSLWQRRFGGDRAVLGRALDLNGEPHTVVGVTPASFRFGSNVDLFAPIGSGGGEDMKSRSRHSGVYVLARLKAGATVEGAREEMKTIAARLAAQYPETNSGNGTTVQLFSEFFVGSIRPSLMMLLGAVGLVLLIACANIANLLLARAAARSREIAIRTALGASRLRVMRQLLVESVLLALVGGAAGLLLAVWSMDLLRSLAADNLPPTAVIGLDSNVLLFTLGLSLLTGLVFGLAPAIQASRADLNASLKEGARGQTGGASRRRVRSALVVSEVALSLLLLVGAGLLLKSFVRLREAPLGFEPSGLLTVKVARKAGGGEGGSGGAARGLAYFEELSGRVRALPGVKAVAYSAGMPQLGAIETISWPEGRPDPPPGKAPQTVLFVTSPDYLKALGIRLVRGRFFDERDTLRSPRVAVIDEAFARAIFPGEDPVGRRLKSFELEGVAPAEIVGVVEHVNNYGAAAAEPVQPQLYYAFGQIPEKSLPDFTDGVLVAARAAGDPAALAPLVRREAQAVDASQPLYQVVTMEQALAQSIATQRLSTTMLTFFAAVALVLAGVGIYGVMSYAVTQRRHEIGVRMALGARPRDVLWMVVGQGMLLTLAGLALGLLGALALTRVMSSLLYGVSATDPFIFLTVSLALGAVALLANLVPARRAMRVDPLVALRYE
jgi:putative ABC transport system permease protein